MTEVVPSKEENRLMILLVLWQSRDEVVLGGPIPLITPCMTLGVYTLLYISTCLAFRWMSDYRWHICLTKSTPMAHFDVNSWEVSLQSRTWKHVHAMQRRLTRLLLKRKPILTFSQSTKVQPVNYPFSWSGASSKVQIRQSTSYLFEEEQTCDYHSFVDLCLFFRKGTDQWQISTVFPFVDGLRLFFFLQKKAPANTNANVTSARKLTHVSPVDMVVKHMSWYNASFESITE